MSNEENIIKDRVTTTEIIYKRLLKLSNTVCSGDYSDKQALKQQVDAELANYYALLTKWQLQINMNAKEQTHYDEQREACEAQIQELTDKTDELQTEWDQAQEIRKQRQEYNTMIDEMVRAKKVKAQDDSWIIAQLNSTRADDEREIEHMKQEIEELTHQKELLKAAWTERKDRFKHVVDTIQQFKQDVLEPEPEPEPETREQSHDDYNDDDINKMDTSG